MSVTARRIFSKIPFTRMFVAFMAVVFTLMSGIMPRIDTQKEFKNIIIMIGDGMGENHLLKAKQERGISLAMETMPIRGQSVTSSVVRSTDSAAGATALACGVRTVINGVGVYPEDVYQVCKRPMNLTELAQSLGKSTGIVTSDDNTGATPACFSAHTDHRGNRDEIAAQQAVSNIDLIWSYKSSHTDVDKVQANGYTVVTNKRELNALESGSKSFGQFTGDIWRTEDTIASNMPTLSELTDKAIDMLDDDEDGFFLMIEGAHIDKFSHSNKSENMTEAVEAFDDAVKEALDFAKKDGETLIIVTADHETGGIKLSGDEYVFTKTSHSTANVPLFVYGTDQFITNGKKVMNKQIAQFMAMSMGDEVKEFPIKVKIQY
ncbi:MAG: alkaline phosphatase [Clostridiales bacterium]|nr:alkaline phosphatase [Clostridiales bacterium]